MELQFFHERVNEMDPKLLIDRIRRMASGEVPLFPTMLSLVYDKVVEKALTKCTPFGPGPSDCAGGESLFRPTPPPPQASTSNFNIPPSPTVDTIDSFSNFQVLAFAHGPVPPITTPSAWLRCQKCGEVALLRDLYEGLRCPQCPTRGKKKGRPFMECTSCYASQTIPKENCVRKKCGKRFM